ncbi:MAG TPA: hypothetical protein VHV32_07535 [Candidatus Angelobacter sp.]|nr:hypothetical protein [Candidatus Angelobacter sp.]
MAHFVLVINQVPIAGFEKILSIVASSGNQIKFIPHSTNQNGVNTQNGMTGPNDKGLYDIIRLEFDHGIVDKAAEILKIFAGLPK